MWTSPTDGRSGGTNHDQCAAPSWNTPAVASMAGHCGTVHVVAPRGLQGRRHIQRLSAPAHTLPSNRHSSSGEHSTSTSSPPPESSVRHGSPSPGPRHHANGLPPRHVVPNGQSPSSSQRASRVGGVHRRSTVTGVALGTSTGEPPAASETSSGDPAIVGVHVSPRAQSASPAHAVLRPA